MTPAGILDDRNFTRPTNRQTLAFPLLIVGGSTAAYSAALGALQAGATVCLVQPHWVLGGQFTAQALPASDDGRLLTPYNQILPEPRDPQQLRNSEEFCLSRSQRQFRDRQRQLQPVEATVIQNPGGSWVSHLSVTPVVASIALNEAILPFIETKQLTLIPCAEPTEILFQQEPNKNRRVVGVVFRDTQTQHQFTIQSQITLEATDLGDLLELGQIDSRIGQEARAETGEAALPETAYPLCQQAITVCAVVERQPAENLPPPAGYNQKPWLQSQDFTCDFWFQSEGQWQCQSFYDVDGMFRYRRLQRSVADDQVRLGDVTVLNWSTSPLGCNDGPPNPDAPLGCGNDYVPGVLVGVSRAERQAQIKRACDRTQAYVHFLQTETGDLKPRGDLTWTPNGIALAPYIREARRGIALTTIRHQDVAKKFFPDSIRARTFRDSVGIGQYHYLDMHPNVAAGQVELGDGHDALPFTIPLGALIPKSTDGLILSSKSIGTTHITNAAYRMHPAEWAIGEAGGHLAAFALRAELNVREVAAHHTQAFQQQLTQAGIPIVWLNDVSHNDPDFAAIQRLATALLSQTSATLPPELGGRGGQCRAEQFPTETDIQRINQEEGFIHKGSLSFRPDAIATPTTLLKALTALLHPQETSPILPQTDPSHLDAVKTDIFTQIEALEPHQPLTHAAFLSLFQGLEPHALAQLSTTLPSENPVLRQRDVARVLNSLRY